MSDENAKQYCDVTFMRISMVLIIIFGALRKIAQKTVSVVLSVRSSVRLSAWKNAAPTGRIFIKFDI